MKKTLMFSIVLTFIIIFSLLLAPNAQSTDPYGVKFTENINNFGNISDSMTISHDSVHKAARIKINKADPNVSLNFEGGTSIDTNVYKYARIAYKVDLSEITSPESTYKFEIYYYGPSAPWGEASRAEMVINTNNEWNVGVINLATSANWKDTITAFRIDPIESYPKNYIGAVVHVRSVLLFASEADALAYDESFEFDYADEDIIVDYAFDKLGNYDVNIDDLVTATGNARVVQFSAAGYGEDYIIEMFDSNMFKHIGNLDLGKYDKVTITYGADGGAVFEGEGKNSKIRLTNNEFTGTLASANLTNDRPGGWKAGEESVEMDLQDIDFNGPVYLAFDRQDINGVRSGIVVSKIEYNGKDIEPLVIHKGNQIRTSLVPFKEADGTLVDNDLRQGLRFGFKIEVNRDDILIFNGQEYTVKESGALVILNINLTDPAQMVVGGSLIKMAKQTNLINWVVDDTEYQTAYIYNIHKDNSSNEISVRPYVKIEKDGDIKYLYGEIVTASLQSAYNNLPANEKAKVQDADQWFN